MQHQNRFRFTPWIGEIVAKVMHFEVGIDACERHGGDSLMCFERGSRANYSIVRL